MDLLTHFWEIDDFVLGMCKVIDTKHYAAIVSVYQY